MSTSGYTNGHYAFDGYTTTKIYWNIDSNSWHMELLSNPNFLARANIPGDEYPFGTRTWDVFTDDEQQGNFSVDLNLNGVISIVSSIALMAHVSAKDRGTK